MYTELDMKSKGKKYIHREGESSTQEVNIWTNVSLNFFRCCTAYFYNKPTCTFLSAFYPSHPHRFTCTHTHTHMEKVGDARQSGLADFIPGTAAVEDERNIEMARIKQPSKGTCISNSTTSDYQLS